MGKTGNNIRLDNLSLEFISVFALPPVSHVDLAADLGCRFISLRLEPLPYNPEGYSLWSLRQDASLRRNTRAALVDRGIDISLAEGFAVRADKDVRALEADLDLFAELGAQRIATLGMDPDAARCLDQFAQLAEMAGARGIGTQLEFVPYRTIGNLDIALAAWRHVGRSDFQLTIDTMHFARSGGTPEALQSADRRAIGYAQLCDAALISPYTDYMEEACMDRRIPGEGELPLLEILRALPPVPVIGIEVPMLARAEAGQGPRERMTNAFAAARALLDKTGDNA